MTLHMEKYDEAMRRSSQWGQAHLLRFYEELSLPRREALLDEIASLDFELVCGLSAKAAGADGVSPKPDIRPATITNKSSLPASTLLSAYELGMDAMRAGKYAVVTMAGGQGTRLGHDGPKGTYHIRLHRDRTLFEVQADRISEMRAQTGAPLPWYIMTSAENHAATVAYFEANAFIGLRDIAFFQQGSLPMVGFDGKILLEEKHRIRQGPDGNGSSLMAMVRSGVARDMLRRGVEWFYIGNIDNILARITDPLPVGLAMQRHVLCTSKSIMKRSPGEKAGVFCVQNGRPGVVEYTEVSDEMAKLTGTDGQYVYGDAHISCTVLHTDVFDLDGVRHMPYHTALKKTPYIGEDGGRVMPEKPNACKFETFIFDIFPLLRDMVVLRVDREAEFAPIKNLTGEDSPETARALYLNAYNK